MTLPRPTTQPLLQPRTPTQILRTLTIALFPHGSQVTLAHLHPPAQARRLTRITILMIYRAISLFPVTLRFRPTSLCPVIPRRQMGTTYRAIHRPYFRRASMRVQSLRLLAHPPRPKQVAALQRLCQAQALLLMSMMVTTTIIQATTHCQAISRSLAILALGPATTLFHQVISAVTICQRIILC